MKSKLVSVTPSALAVFFLTLVPAVPAAAQETPAQAQVLTNPEVNEPVAFGISPPLSEMPLQSAPQAGNHPAPPVRHPKLQRLMDAAGQPPVADGTLQESVEPLVSTTLGLNLLGVGNGFPGYSVPDAPPDVNLAVGDTQVVQWVNVSYAVFNKTTGAVVAGPIEGNTLWSNLKGPCAANNAGDIIAQWDKIAHRWVLTQPVFVSPYATCIAVSQTPDATGSYYLYQFNQPGFPDYPKWGLMPDAYYQSQNNFGPGGNSFVGAYVCAYERAKLLVGDPSPKQICFQNGTFDDSLLPGDLDSAGTLPPAGQPEVFLGSIDNSNPSTTVYEYLFHAHFTTPTNSTFTGATGTMPVTVATYNLACGGFSACIPQPSPGESLDSLGDRLMYRLAYRNFSGDHQTWLVSHSVTAGSSVGERWYEFHAPENSTNLSVYQQGTFAPDSNYRWMGSIAMDSAQDIALGYSVSSSSLLFPSISYTGRVASDTLGTMETEAQIVAGTGSQVSTSSRWGDYTSMALDAADDCTFWYTGEYYTSTASFDWSTRLASFKFPSCGGTPTPDFSISASPSSQTVVAGNPTSYTVTISPLHSYTGTVNLTNSSPGSGIVASLSPTSVTNGSGTSTLSVTTSGTTAPGNYTITVTGTDGSLVHSTSVTLVVNAPPPPPDFSLSASPTSRTVLEGSSPTYTITVSPVNGFTGTVGLTNSSPGSGINASLSPASVGGGSGNSTLTVSTSATTPAGSYNVTVTGTSGSLTHQVTVTVVVTGDFSITPTNGTLTVHRGSSGTDTVSIAAIDGFTGTVSLSVTGQPNRVNASLSPSSVAGHGSSTLTVNVNRKAAVGKYTLTIKGTSGGVSHTTTVTLTVT